MTDEERAIKASKAKQILEDSVFIEAMDKLRADTVKTLINVDPTNQAAIIEAQCLVKTADNLCSQLSNIVQNAPQTRN